MNERDTLIEQLIKEKGGTKAQYLHLLNAVANHESMGSFDPMQHQIGGGPGKGKYQYETLANGGSGRGLTAARRLRNYYNRIKSPVPKWVDKAANGKDLDATTLTSDQQDMLFLGDMREHPRANFSKVWDNDQSIADFWSDNHHQPKTKIAKREGIKNFNARYENFSKENEFPKLTGPKNEGEGDTRRFDKYPKQSRYELLNPDFPKYRDHINSSRNGVRKNTAQQEGDVSSHIMASGEGDNKYFAYPTLFQDDKNKWYEPDNAFKEAKNKKELYQFDTNEAAESFAQGSWKPIDYANQKAYGGNLNQAAYSGNITTDPPTTASVENVQTGKDFVKNWMAHPVTRERYRANMSGEPTTSQTNLGVDNEVFQKGLTSLENTTTNLKGKAGNDKAWYNNSNIDFYGDVSPGTATHEFTHAAGDISNNLSKYLMKDSGPLTSIRQKHGLDTIGSVKKEFGQLNADNRIKHASYIGQNGELYPRIMEMRQFLNVKPGQPIDDDMVNKLMQDEKTGQTARYYTPEKLKNILNTVASNNNTEQYQNMAAYGGNLNQAAYGGLFNSFNAGGTHESNPNGGIPLGVGSNGKQNTVEQGESSFNFKDGKFIFSHRLKI